MKLPRQRANVLAFIKEEIARGHGFPSHAMIAGHMAWKNPSSAYNCLNGLAGDGYLKRYYVRGERGYRFELTQSTGPPTIYEKPPDMSTPSPYIDRRVDEIEN